MDCRGRLVRHDGPEHVFVFAPIRSGKGMGSTRGLSSSPPAQGPACRGPILGRRLEAQ
ncbi:MAG: hypothetical protein ABJA82_11640 [Myxococcales bacterium]